MTVGEENYPKVLQNFFVHEGLAYRITPFNWKELGYNEENEHPVDIDKFYDNIMNRFKWGGIKENTDYYADETIRRMIYTHRNLIVALAQTMIHKNESDERIIALLEKWHEEFPNEVIRYDAIRDNSIAMASMYKYLYNRCNNNETATLLQDRYTEIATAIALEQYEHLKWYNTFKSKQRSEIIVFNRLNILTQALNILGDTGLSGISINDIASVTARIIENECDEILNTKINILSSNAIVDKKMQLIDYTYSFLKSMGKIPSLDKKISTAFKHICKYENSKLQRFNVNRLSENDVDEIITTLQLIGSVYESAIKLGSEHNNSIVEIKNIYDKNIEKFAPYVLNY